MDSEALQRVSLCGCRSALRAGAQPRRIVSHYDPPG